MSELIHQFGIDWRLLTAQAVNFFILFFLLYRFAYKPILTMLALRREKIVEGLEMREEAARALDEAESKKNALLKEAGEEARLRIEKAESAGKERGEVLLREAHEKSEMLLREGKTRAEAARHEALGAFRQEAVELVRDAVRRVVELSPEKIDRELVKKAVHAAEQASLRSS